jgi:hypothetical protein
MLENTGFGNNEKIFVHSTLTDFVSDTIFSFLLLNSLPCSPPGYLKVKKPAGRQGRRSKINRFPLGVGVKTG